MSDPLNFFTATLEPVQTPKDDIINIMPLAPLPTPSFNVEGQSAQPTQTDWDNIITTKFSQLPKSNIAYTFGEPEKKRYNNPVLSYIPADRLVNAADIEDLYNINQARGKQLMNGFLKAGANAAGTFVSTFLTIPEQIDLFRQGQVIEAFQSDSIFSGVQDWLKGLEDILPNYYSAAERDNPWRGIVPFTEGSANFWGDKVIKNIGFSMGALASGVLIDAGLTAAGAFLTSGGYAPLGIAKTLNNFRRFFTNMYRGMRNTIKASQTLQGANALGRAYQSGTNLIEAGRTLANAQALSKLPRWATTTYLTAQGEAFIEGYHNYVDIKSKGIEDALRNNKPIEAGLEDRAMAAGKYTTAFNLPVIMASNMLQFSNVLYGAKAALRIPRSFISTISDGALSVANNYTFKKGMIEFLKSSGKSFVPEFIEEGSQVLIGNSILDYYSDKKNYESKQSVLGYVMSQIPEVMTDRDFWFEGTIGGITGTLMGSGRSMRYLTRGRQDTQDIVDNMNPVLQRFNGLVKNFTHNIQLNNSIDARVKQDVQFKSMYSVVSDNSRQGTYDIFKDSIEDLKALDLDQFNQAFGTEFKTDGDKIQHLQNILNQADNIKANIDLANEMYSENPYVAKSTLGQLVKQLFPDANQNQLAYFFEEFKENIGYTMSRLQHTKEREGQINTYFRETLDPKLDGENIQSVLGYFATLSRTGNRKPYMAWKNVQLQGLREQLEYYNELGDATKLTRDVRNMKKGIENRIAEINEHLEKVKALEGDELLAELFSENASVGSIQEFQAKVDEYTKLKTEQANLEQEAQDPDSVAKNTLAAEKLAEEIAKRNTKQPIAGEEDSEEIAEDEIEVDDDSVTYGKVELTQDEFNDLLNATINFISRAKENQILGYFNDLFKKYVDEDMGDLLLRTIEHFENQQASPINTSIIQTLNNIYNTKFKPSSKRPPAPAAPTAKPPQPQPAGDTKGDIKKRRQEVERISKLPFVERIPALINAGIIKEVYQYGDRPIVVVNINGELLPFYRSFQGTSGKKKGKWYPMFGFGKSKSTSTEIGWLIKPSIEDLENNLNSKAVKEYSDIINSTLNWEHSLDTESLNNPFFKPFVTLKSDEEGFNEKIFGKKDFNVFNDGKTSYTHINSIMNKINAKYNAELSGSKQPQPAQAPTPTTDVKGNIEKEKSTITNVEFEELKRLAKYFLENPKEPTVAGSVVTKYPVLFKAVTDIERRRQEELSGIRFRERGSDSIHSGSKTFEAELKRMVAVRKEEGQENIDEEYLKTLIEERHKDTRELKSEINARYDAELSGSKQPQPSQAPTPTQSEIEAERATIERRRQEEIELRNSIIPKVTSLRSYRESITNPNSINKNVWESEKAAEEAMWKEMQEVSDWIDSMVENNIPAQKIIDKVNRLINGQGKASRLLFAHEKEKLFKFIKAKSKGEIKESLINIIKSSREEINAKYDAKLIEQQAQQPGQPQQPTTSIIWNYQDIIDYFNTKGNEKKSLKLIEGDILGEPRQITLKLMNGQLHLVEQDPQNPKKNILKVYNPVSELLNPYYEVDASVVKPGSPDSKIITDNIRDFMGDDYIKYPTIALTLSQTKLFTVKC